MRQMGAGVFLFAAHVDHHHIAATRLCHQGFAVQSLHVLGRIHQLRIRLLKLQQMRLAYRAQINPYREASPAPSEEGWAAAASNTLKNCKRYRYT